MDTTQHNQSGDKARLSPKRRPSSAKMHRSDEEIAKATARIVRALGVRLEEGDPDESIPLLAMIEHELEAVWARAIAGWRASGFSDGEIGAVLGVTKQAVQQRWPRA